MTVRKCVDALIDWYELNETAAGRPIYVSATPRTARKFAKRASRGGPLIYRERIIIPTREPGSGRRPTSTQADAFVMLGSAGEVRQ